MDHAILEREALKLPPHERALLADVLLGSLDAETIRETEEACAHEAEDRYQAYVRGQIQAVDGPKVFQQLRERREK